MHFVIMNAEYFNSFSINQNGTNIYQTLEYATLMQSAGHTVEFVGVVDSTETILCAAMVVTQTFQKDLRFAYAPGGFIVDYSHQALLSFFLTNLKRHLESKKITFFKTDPTVTMFEHDLKGNRTGNGIGTDLINLMVSSGFNHNGFNTHFESLKPRFVAVVENGGSLADLTQNNNQDTIYKTSRAFEKGVSVYKGTAEHINEFYEIVKDKYRKRSLNYYQNLFNAFNRTGNVDIYFAVLEPQVFSNKARALYEMEVGVNDTISLELQNASEENREELLNKKMESDKKMVIYKSDISDSIKLLQAFPNGIKIGTLMVLKHGTKAFFLIDGVNDKFRKFYPKHLIYAKVIEEYVKNGLELINLNAVIGNFNEQDPLYRLNQFKTGFANKIVEYPGEFDIILNQLAYFKLANNNEFQSLIKKTNQ